VARLHVDAHGRMAGAPGVFAAGDATDFDIKQGVRVRDDGRGVPPESIRGMRERAILIGAKLAIDSLPGGGTEVRLTILRTRFAEGRDTPIRSAPRGPR
jgi:signal transduction histidine kinase